MVLNWKEINLLLADLDLENYLIQKINQPEYTSLCLDLHKPGKSGTLFISLLQGSSCFFFTNRKYPKKIKLQRFAQLLRSRISGGRITSAEQLENERIVKLSITASGEQYFLFLILRGNNTNAVLCSSENRIIDSCYRRPGQKLTSGAEYKPFADKGKPVKKEFSIREYPADKNFSSYIAEQWESENSHNRTDRLLQQAEKIYQSRKSFLQSRIENIDRQLEKADDYSIHKQKGDILLASQHSIPAGSDAVSLHDFYNDCEITIKIDNTLTVQENAENYYKKYKKAKNSIQHLKKDLTASRSDLASLEEQYSKLSETESEHEFKSFISSEQQSLPVQSGPSTPGLQCTSHGFLFLIGRNARENDTLLRRHVRGNDYWLHTRDYPGGYIFIKFKSGKNIPLDVFLDAAQLALHFSKGKGSTNCDIYYTQVKYLRRAKHGVLGTVIPTREKNLTVSYNSDLVKKLLGQN